MVMKILASVFVVGLIVIFNLAVFGIVDFKVLYSACISILLAFYLYFCIWR